MKIKLINLTSLNLLESLERYKTDLSEYAFILEQQYKKKVIPQQPKKKKYDIIISRLK